MKSARQLRRINGIKSAPRKEPPFPVCKDLSAVMPEPAVGRGGAVPCRVPARSVLMHDDAAQASDAFRDPQYIGHSHLQLAWRARIAFDPVQ